MGNLWLAHKTIVAKYNVLYNINKKNLFVLMNIKTEPIFWYRLFYAFCRNRFIAYLLNTSVMFVCLFFF